MVQVPSKPLASQSVRYRGAHWLLNPMPTVSQSRVSLADVSGTSYSLLTGTVNTGTTAVDVASTINGVGATGSGQLLTAATGTDADGLKL